MLGPEAVVVADHAAGLRNVEQVVVGVQVVLPVGVHLAQLLEVGNGRLHLPHVVVRVGHLQGEINKYE